MFKLVEFVRFSFSCIFGSLLLCRFLLLFFLSGNFHCGNFFFSPFFSIFFFWHSLVANPFSSHENIKSHKTLWYSSWNIKLQKFNRKKKAIWNLLICLLYKFSNLYMITIDCFFKNLFFVVVTGLETFLLVLYWTGLLTRLFQEFHS